MSHHDNDTPPAQFRYAVGAGLGLLVGGTVGLFTDTFAPLALIGVAAGLVVAYLVQLTRS